MRHHVVQPDVSPPELIVHVRGPDDGLVLVVVGHAVAHVYVIGYDDVDGPESLVQVVGGHELVVDLFGHHGDLAGRLSGLRPVVHTKVAALGRDRLGPRHVRRQGEQKGDEERQCGRGPAWEVDGREKGTKHHVVLALVLGALAQRLIAPAPA